MLSRFRLAVLDFGLAILDFRLCANRQTPTQYTQHALDASHQVIACAAAESYLNTFDLRVKVRFRSNHNAMDE